MTQIIYDYVSKKQLTFQLSKSTSLIFPHVDPTQAPSNAHENTYRELFPSIPIPPLLFPSSSFLPPPQAIISSDSAGRRAIPSLSKEQ